MVLTVRYPLLRAIGGSLEYIAEHKGTKIDVIILRQLQKLFEYLKQSERLTYYPVEFYFSLKDMDANLANTSKNISNAIDLLTTPDKAGLFKENFVEITP
jgi:hypothetical protein